MNDSVRAPPVAPVAPGIDSRGLAAAVSAFLMWGLLPLYLKQLHAVPVLQFTAHRLAWGFLFACGWLAARGEVGQMRSALADPQTLRRLGLSATLIATNWLIFMWGIANQHVIEVSLGYFIAPLVNVAIGVCLFRERLNRAQWFSVAFAAAGVLYLTWVGGRPPWISLGLALSFGTYGLVRKVVKVDALPGFAGETLLLFPIAAGYVIWCQFAGDGAFGHLGLAKDALLIISGPLTAIPLVLFAVGARRIPLSTVGLLQYIAPSLQLIGAVLVFGESFSGPRVLGFGLIWAALLIYGIDGLLASRRQAANEH